MGKVIKHQKLPSNWLDREILRNKGQFWTPSWVANAMAAYVSQDTELVFDPATGRGAFLQGLLSLNKPNISFYGTDIDLEVLNDEIYNIDSCFVEQRDFLKSPPNRKFKAIVGNPPYIRHHRIDDETKLFIRNQYINITGSNIDGRAGYHIYFLVQALNSLEENGRLAFIMPADTCEGKFSKGLWNWISNKFCIEAVITFEEKATPFPDVDTNALVFLIKNTAPQENFYWVKAKESYTSDLLNLILSNFIKTDFSSLEIVKRKLSEGLETGFSRPEQNHKEFKYHLNDFATVMRGIATGANEFFFLTEAQVKETGISNDFFKRAIGRTRDVNASIFSFEDLDNLNLKGRPTYLLSLNNQDTFPNEVLTYIKSGEKLELPNRSLIKQRKPWFKMEKREIPPLLFAYLGRRDVRFIKNEANVVPLTGFLCVYPIYSDAEYINNLWQALNHPDTLENLRLVGKSYGSGAIKVEPGNLSKLPIPSHIVELFNIKRPHKNAVGQLDVFREPKNGYKRKIKDTTK